MRGDEDKHGEKLVRASIRLGFSQFALPPVRDALVVGKLAPVGINALSRAFEEIAPGAFKAIEVDHPVIEAVLVRLSDLRKVPEDKLVPLILRHAERIMDETDSLHVVVSIDINVEEDIVIPWGRNS